MNTAPPSGFTAGHVLMHRYQLDAPLAAGNVTELWNGQDLVLKRPISIKLLHPHLAGDSALMERFRLEAIGAARLAHPNIVPTYDAGIDSGVGYVITALIHSPKLSDLLANAPLPLEVAIGVARQVSEAVAVAHSVGIVHHDLNPDNIYVAGEDHRVLVTDFGLATAVLTSNNNDFQPNDRDYSAPEQPDGISDARSDVFSIGALLRTMVGYTAGDAASVVDKATAESPADRYQNGTELSVALGELAEKVAPAPIKRSAHRLPPPKAPRVTRQEAPRPPVDDEEVTAPHQHLNTGEYRFTQDAAPAPAPQYHQQDIDPVSVRDSPSSNLIKILSITVVLLLLVAAVGLGVIINQAGSNGDDGDDGEATSTATTSAPLALAAAQAFDPPPGDLTENNATVANVIDGDPATSWATSTYASSTFGNLKTGVGLVVRSNTDAALKSLSVDSDGQGWNAQVYVADSVPTTLGGWGDVVDNQSGLGSNANFDLHDKTGSAVLIWITDLGSANRLAINEVEIGA